MSTLGFHARQEAVLSVLVEDVTKSSEIEGEHLSVIQVRSSIARRLGIEIAGLPPSDRSVEGVVEMMLDATQRFDQPLTADRLFGWHSALFPTGRSGMYPIVAGAWRDDSTGPMQIISGPIGKEEVHYVAPPASRLQAEMDGFLYWFENSEGDPILKAALGHFWFVIIHPFDDGNGRIARAIADMALARADGMSQRFYSMSAQIRKARNGYYEILQRTQGGDLDITAWVSWFLARLNDSLGAAEGVLLIVAAKRAFWDIHQEQSLNERQIKIVNLLLEGFQGKLRTDKYAKLMKCSNRTALRDIEELLQLGILKRENGGGRSTSYVLA